MPGIGHADERDVLTFSPPDAAVDAWVLGFVYRHDRRGGQVVHELPELRPSIQIMLGDDYWLRDQKDARSWAPVPRIAFWGPRVTWGYGFARREIRAFGIGLTARGVEALIGRPIAPLVDKVFDLASLAPDLSAALAVVVTKGEPADWQHEASGLVLERCSARSAQSKGLASSIALLAQGRADAARRASWAAGLCGRHFRRAFRSQYGLSPRQYRRVLRIDRLLRQLHPHPWEADDHRFALSFCDQAHMIREFKALTGVTPGAYVRAKRANGEATIRSVAADGIDPPAAAMEHGERRVAWAARVAAAVETG